ncbi:uncharacterized protein LOC128396451 [Panonychus citri]|uniref:uncharacterized protein LOC128389603 n=1 Tax=Panonychus citri TaxID=50023 RepID=UPI0023080E42|nr:uncharacterized protein LOC128389603 [Panonychus citri]XP_053213015.1 uncharacterized protein LOC128396451 [Panonychus citri]
MKILIIVLLSMGLESSSTAPLEEAKFLRQIVDQYSPPLIISFLHSRMDNNQQMIKKIKNSLTDLDKSKRDIFDLAEKTLQLLSNQLTALEKADYFDHDGTEKVKFFVEQFIMVDEFYPIDFGSYGMTNIELTVDGILEQLKTQTFDKLHNQTITLIENYLSDIEDKESNVNCNRLQQVSISLAKDELHSLINHLYTIKTTNYNNGQPYNNNNINDPRKDEIDKSLKRLKTIVDFFYSQFNYLADKESASTSKPTINTPNYQPEMSNKTYFDLNIDAEVATTSPLAVRGSY